jgi:hypothetical protein
LSDGIEVLGLIGDLEPIFDLNGCDRLFLWVTKFQFGVIYLKTLPEARRHPQVDGSCFSGFVLASKLRKVNVFK